MTQALLAVGALFLLVYAPLAVLAWRRPLLARLAFRESIRRPGQSALLIVGLMTATGGITASLVVTDSFAKQPPWSRTLGAVDLTVTAPGGATFPVDVAKRLASDPALSPYVDGVQAGVELTGSAADIDQRLGKPGVLIVGFDPASQRRFGTFQLTDGRRASGTELTSGDVLLSQGLADLIEARTGDRIRIGLGTATNDVALRVYGIARASGPGGYGASLAVFVPLATAQQLTGDARINVVRVAARGGRPDDADAARRAAGPLRAALQRIPDGSSLTINEVRVDALRNALGGVAFELGTTMGFSLLIVLASMALIVNLVLALVDERRPRLAVFRALGLTRTGLVELAVLEGAIYSVVAAAAALPIGAAAGVFLASQAWHAFQFDPTDLQFAGYPVDLSVGMAPLAVAFAAGAMITLGTVAVTAYRTSRLAIAEAIRDLPEPAAPPRNGWRRRLLLVAAGVIGAAVLVPNDPRTRLLGGVLLIATAAGLLRGHITGRLRATLAGLLLAVWAGVVSVASRGSDLALSATTLFSVVIVVALGLSLAAAANLKLIEASLWLLGNRQGNLQATLRPPLAYLSRRPVRTGLATAAFALVLVLVTLIAIWVAPQKIDYALESASFDIAVVTSGSEPVFLPPEVSSQIDEQLTIPIRLYKGPLHAPAFGGNGSSVSLLFYELPDMPGDAGPSYLGGDREKRFRTDAEAWKSVRDEPGLVVFSFGGGVAPGDKLTLQGSNGPLQLTVAGSQATTILNGVVASAATIAQIPTAAAGSTALLRTAPGSNPTALARQIERANFDRGVQATSTRDIIDQDHLTNLQYVTEYDVLLHMGLLVGALALTMVVIRAAVERRRTIGILRALGYQPARVVAGLVAESALVVTIGVVTGVCAALLLALFQWLAGNGGTGAGGIDEVRMGIALAIVYGTVLIAGLPLAVRIARIAPADAIRVTG
jgi:putative ABC transport system permease protein